MESLSERLVKLRKEKNLTVRELANIIGVPESTYREWEYGRPVSGPPYVKIAEALSVSLSFLMTGNQSNNLWVMNELDRLEQFVIEMKIRAASRI